MIDNKELLEAQKKSLAHQNILEAAAKKLEEHQKKMDSAKAMSTQQQDASDIFDITPITNFFGSFFNDTPSLVKPHVKPALLSLSKSQKHLHNELPDYIDFRDNAFFEYMQALREEHKIVSPMMKIFVKNMHELIPTTEFVIQYQKNYEKLRRENQKIKMKIERVSRMQRSWCEYFIESFLPVFCLFMAYQPFQIRIEETMKHLNKQHLDIILLMDKLHQLFEENWINAYGTNAPEKMHIYIVETVEYLVDKYEDDDLNHLFQAYQETLTVSHLLAFYRRVCQLNYQDYKNNNRDKLRNMFDALVVLYPHMNTELQNEEKTMMQELELHELIQNQSRSEEDIFATLAHQYITFLTNKSRITFYKMYSYIDLDKHMRKHPIAKEIKKTLKACYPEAVNEYKKQFIAHINKKDSKEFVKRYASLRFEHPIYKGMLNLIETPTWYHLDQLQKAIQAHRDNSYYYEPFFNHIMTDLINLCIKTPLGISEDNQSVVSDDNALETRISRANSENDFSPLPLQKGMECYYAQNLFASEQEEETLHASNLNDLAS